MFRRFSVALLGALIAACFSVPAEAAGGAYSSIRFANNTAWCVWYTVWEGNPGALGPSWVFVKAQNVPPNAVVTVTGNERFKLNYPYIRIKTEIYQHGNCSGPTVGWREISKHATQPNDNGILFFGAEAQLDHGGGVNFNLYWGNDKVLPGSIGGNK
jgi:hypothetical protein